MIAQITRCPDCETSFRVTDEQLRMANGAVRCGSCLTVFQADLHMESEGNEGVEESADFESEQEDVQVPQDLEEQQRPQEQYQAQIDEEPIHQEAPEESSEEPEQAPESSEQEAVTSDQEMDGTREIADEVIYLGYDRSEEDTPKEVDERQSIVESYWGSFELYADSLRSPESPVRAPEASPEYVEEAYLEDPDTIVGEFEPATRVSLGWAACAMLLIFTSIAQYFYFNFERYAVDARYRTYAIKACGYLGCSLPDYSDAASLTTGELSIRTHPEVSESLIVDAIVRNTAVFPQRFPGVRLQFYDLRGRQVAARTFSANEYLAGELRGLRYIPANTEVRFALEIVDPGDVAVGYDISVVVR